MKIKFTYYLVWIVVRITTKVFFRIRIKGDKNLPKTGGCILATNHISHYDPPLIGSWSRRQLYFVAKQELFKGWLFGKMLPRVNVLPIKRGVFDRKAIEMSVDIIKNGGCLIIFPEGTRSKTDHFLDPKPGIGMLAIRSQVPVVPAYIHGSNKLKQCLFGQDRLSITYGEPIPISELERMNNNKDGYAEIAQLVMNRILEIKKSVIS